MATQWGEKSWQKHSDSCQWMVCALSTSAIRQWDDSAQANSTEHVFSINRQQLVHVRMPLVLLLLLLLQKTVNWRLCQTDGAGTWHHQLQRRCITASGNVCSFFLFSTCLLCFLLWHSTSCGVQKLHGFIFPLGSPVDFQLFVWHRGLCLQSNWLCQIFTYEHIATLESMYHCE